MQGQNGMTCTCEIAGDFVPHENRRRLEPQPYKKHEIQEKPGLSATRVSFYHTFFMRKHGSPPLLRGWVCLWFFYIKGRFFFFSTKLKLQIRKGMVKAYKTRPIQDKTFNTIEKLKLCMISKGVGQSELCWASLLREFHFRNVMAFA